MRLETYTLNFNKHAARQGQISKFREVTAISMLSVINSMCDQLQSMYFNVIYNSI